jgi:murein DD-endopeptidase MepM/ murein hydrolase activator NlpD
MQKNISLRKIRYNKTMLYCMIRAHFSIILLLCLFSLPAMTQIVGTKDYFRYPLGSSPRLNGNFGEMRPNHFHMGLDLYTSKEDLPVYAAADGYISRIKIETGGFGRALYLNHPNGTTTLYAHMNRFIPAAESFLESKQYEQRSWKIDISLPDRMIQVKKGQLIGYSGNTGASLGPHVHFEIRDTRTDACINPLLYNLGLKDQTPPEIYQLAFYDRDKSVYEQKPVLIPLQLKENEYHPSKTIVLPFKKAFLAVHAIDRITGFPNADGIYSAFLYRNGLALSGFQLDNISYEKTRNLNGHIDFVHRKRGGPYLQMIFPPKSYGLNHYNVKAGKDYFDVPAETERLELMVSDAHGNLSKAIFNVKFEKGSVENVAVNGRVRITPGNGRLLDFENIQFLFKEGTFYDAFDFQVRPLKNDLVKGQYPGFQTFPDNVPANNYFTVRILAPKTPGAINSDRMLIKRTLQGTTEIKKAKLENGFFVAQFRDFGSFELIQDMQGPVIKTVISNGLVLREGNKLEVEVSDNHNNIKDFKAFAGNNWLMFKPSGKRFTYSVDKHLPLGEHKLTIVVLDEAGNTTIREWNIKRI